MGFVVKTSVVLKVTEFVKSVTLKKSEFRRKDKKIATEGTEHAESKKDRRK